MINNKTLHLVLKRKWFDMILSGVKTDEYRENSYYWFKRLIFNPFKQHHPSHIKNLKTLIIRKGTIRAVNILKRKIDYFDSVTFSHGYRKGRDQFKIEFKGIEMDHGKEEWGAAPKEKYFVIKCGKILSLNGIKNPNFIDYPQFAMGDFYCDEDDYKTELNKTLKNRL